MTPPNTIKQGLIEAAKILHDPNCQGSQEICTVMREVRELAAFALQRKSQDLLLIDPNEALSLYQWQFIKTLCQRRLKGEPVAKIIQRKGFWRLPEDLITNEYTLDPRPDSETLIEALLTLRPNKEQSFNILDLGSGTGCLIISALHEYPNSKGVAVDQSLEALKITKANAENNKVIHRLKCLHSHWFTKVSGKFDIILSNPPYIPSKDIETLPISTKFDPKTALDGGVNGISCYQAIFKDLAGYLAPDGIALFEIGQGQENDVTALAKKHGFALRSAHKDLAGIVRVLYFTTESSQST